MDFSFLSSINYAAVAASSVVFFILGSFWFAPMFFGSIWREELKHHNVTIKQPAQNVLMTKMLLTFGANILASFSMAELVVLTGSNTVETGLMLGTIAALGFAATAVASVFIWENRSVKLFLIDTGYPVLGIITVAVVLSVWR